MPRRRASFIDANLDPRRSLREWLARPDKQVTRAEVWTVLLAYEGARDRVRRDRRWWRRLWRWLTAPIVPPEQKPPCSSPLP